MTGKKRACIKVGMNEQTQAILEALGAMEVTIERLERAASFPVKSMRDGDTMLLLADTFREQHDRMFEACKAMVTAEIVRQFEDSLAGRK